MNYTSYFKLSDKSVLHMERLNAFTLLKSVDNGKLFQTFSTRKEKLLHLNFTHFCSLTFDQLVPVFHKWFYERRYPIFAS